MSVGLLEPVVAARGGLGEAGQRLGAEGLRIAYLGASVTRQQEGYRPRLHGLIRARHGKPHDHLAAALGGIPAASIVFLADEFAMKRSPDICLIEVTTAPLQRKRSIADAAVAMDGILAKSRAAGAAPCLLHLPQPARPDRFDAVLAAFEEVAGRHGVPSIDLATPVHEAIAAGEIDPESWFRDGTHTTETGSEEIARLADEALAEIAAASGPAGATPPPPEGDLRSARMVPPDDADLSAGEPGRWRMAWRTFEVTEATRLTRRLEGAIDGVAVVLGPESGELWVRDDDGEQRVMAWDDWCHYERFSAVVFPRRCARGSEVTIGLTDRIPDYAASRRPIDPPERRGVRVVGFLEAP